MEIPFVNGEGIHLRELRESDLEGSWYTWFNDSDVTTFQNKKIFPNTKEKQRKYFDQIAQSDSDVVLAIVHTETMRHIGNVGLHKIDWVHRSAELGIVIGEKDFWGKGFGRQAWKLISDYGFQTLNLHRIFALVLKENVSSIKCAEGAGFLREGLISQMIFKNGGYHDMIYFNKVRG